MLEFSAMLKAIAATLAGFAGVMAAAAIGLGVWLLLAWLLGVVLVAIAGRERGRNGLAWTLLAVLLTPPLAGLLLLVLPSRVAERDRRLAKRRAGGRALCPMCAEVIRIEALRCRHCGAAVGPTAHSGALRDASRAEQLIAGERDDDQRATGQRRLRRHLASEQPRP